MDSKVELLLGNLDVMAELDFIFARAKLSLTWDGIRVRISAHPVIKLIKAKHPLLGKACNPISVSIGWDWRQLIITGPNAGGKTITLKTIGLLAMMVQSGLLIPAKEGTVFGIFEHVFADVGDGQSIEHSLSTFSAHMAAVKEMLDVAGKRSLLLLDELAAGTDPSEGISLSIALLEELLGRESIVAATTHFNEIKRFAAYTPGCANARMAFDPVTLRSLYRLEIGEAGDSFAFAIARRFGLPEHVIARAELRMAMGDHDRNEEWSGKGSKKEFIPFLEEEDEEADGQHNTTIKHSCVENGQEEIQQEERVHYPLQVGDSIWIPLMKCIGTVEQLPNHKDEVIVQALSKRITLNRSQISRDIP